MTEYGIGIPKEVVNDALKMLKAEEKFSLAMLEHQLIKRGIPHYGGTDGKKGYVANRIDDRIIQKLKREGHIKLSNERVWQWFANG
ncbi:hypothetical protein OH460_07985 [Vibrio sp. Makdt]|uniref:hypothetical protein n=1 Tax=Vibrio sp. Makdt TaxID=2998828 RepID=UPI0022CD5C39|nr:hypothetical protein [Vibrio sp. Makdt]MDA0152237.1 hypothetical protein [Vibrio sp. Makdt]